MIFSYFNLVGETTPVGSPQSYKPNTCSFLPLQKRDAFRTTDLLVIFHANILSNIVFQLWEKCWIVYYSFTDFMA